MRTRTDKQTFVKVTNQHIALRNALTEFYFTIYLPTLKEFDGKVYNIRFIKKLREKAKEMNEFAYIKEREYDHIEMQIRLSQFSYTDYESMYFPCVLTTEGRLDYQKTIENEMGKAWVKNHDKYTEEMNDSIVNYDKYMETAEELQKALDKWNELPHTFRQTIDTSYMRIY